MGGGGLLCNTSNRDFDVAREVLSFKSYSGIPDVMQFKMNLCSAHDWILHFLPDVTITSQYS